MLAAVICISFIIPFQEGSLENLGKILLQDSFVIYDAKNRRKGKERHVFLFEQALLFSKEQKDSFGKVRYSYKGKLKVCGIDMLISYISRFSDFVRT